MLWRLTNETTTCDSVNIVEYAYKRYLYDFNSIDLLFRKEYICTSKLFEYGTIWDAILKRIPSKTT